MHFVIVVMCMIYLLSICLCSADEVHTIVSGKLALKYSGPEVEAMKLIAQASAKRSLADFQQVCNFILVVVAAFHTLSSFWFTVT